MEASRSYDYKQYREAYFPERRIAILSVAVEKVPDYFVEPVRLLAEHGVGLLSCIIQAHPNQPIVHATLFLDLTESDLKAFELKEKFDKIPYVRRVMLMEAPLNWDEALLIAFPLGELHSLFGMFKEIGAGGEALAYHMGVKAGEAIYNRMATYYKNNREILEHFLIYNESLGRGSFKIEEYREGESCIIHVNDFLLEHLGMPETRIGNFMFRGTLAGLFSKMWNRRVNVEETKCITKGEPCCEFQIKPKHLAGEA